MPAKAKANPQSARPRSVRWIAGTSVAALAIASFTLEQTWPIKLYPALMNLSLLAVFAFSLWRPPTVILRLARLAEPDLPDAVIPYTRAVTKVWCAFFVVNASAAIITALWASTQIWLLYNGVVAYVLMGLLFGSEWLVRRGVKRRLAAGADMRATPRGGVAPIGSIPKSGHD